MVVMTNSFAVGDLVNAVRNADKTLREEVFDHIFGGNFDRDLVVTLGEFENLLPCAGEIVFK